MVGDQFFFMAAGWNTFIPWAMGLYAPGVFNWSYSTGQFRYGFASWENTTVMQQSLGKLGLLLLAAGKLLEASVDPDTKAWFMSINARGWSSLVDCVRHLLGMTVAERITYMASK